MSTHEHETIASLIERAYFEELTPADRERLRLELDDCPACRRYYDEITEIDRAVTDRPLDLAPVSVDRIWSAVEEDLVEERSRKAQGWRPLAWLAPGFAALAGLFYFATAAPEFQTRGTDQGPSPFGLTAFVIEPESQTVRRATEKTVRMQSGEVLQLAVTARRAGEIGIVGVDAQGDLHWYHAEADLEAPFVVTGNEVEKPVGPAWRIRAEDSPVSIWVIEKRAGVSFGEDAPQELDFANPTLLLEAER